GAHIRKSGDNILRETFKKFSRENTPSLLMMLDIDNFKKVNDTYGHDVGDIVLKKISQEIQKNIRETDCLIRWGGEEFLLLYPVLDSMHHRQVGEKILQCVRKLSFQCGDITFKVTVSIGSSYFHEEDTDYLQAVKRADVSLYHSKQTGKNKYTNSEEDM
ncbi:MAG: GGDEF domain-containing protein, partial [Lachnospiraceae bacterium]|nr:GGDEF domain-containing protein [Lachnospiraceae bacterium]